jgi:hypothetical protein
VRGTYTPHSVTFEHALHAIVDERFDDAERLLTYEVRRLAGREDPKIARLRKMLKDAMQ